MKKNFLSIYYVVMAALCLGTSSSASAVTTPEAVVCNGIPQALIFDTAAASPTVVPITMRVGANAASITPDGSQAWVCNKDDNTVSIINLTTKSVLDTISVGSAPMDVCITPDGRQAWVTNFNDDTVSVIDVATRAVTVTIGLPPGSGPEGIAITPDGTQAWVCDAAANPGALSVINVAAPHAVTTFAISSSAIGPSSIAIRPDGTEAWVANATGNNVTVISMGSHTVITNIAVGILPFGIAITPDGTETWVTNFGSRTASVIDVSSRTVVDTITIASTSGPGGIAFTPDGQGVWITNLGDNDAVEIDRATKTILNVVPCGASSGPTAIALTPDQAPTARFTVSTSGSVASLDASASSSPSETIATYRWNFGDGSPEQEVTVPHISHTYANEGRFRATLTVTNTQGTSTARTFTGHSASNNGSPSAQSSRQVTITLNFTPSTFTMKPKILSHCKKMFMKMKWTQCTSPTVSSYQIFARHKKIASISAQSGLRIFARHAPPINWRGVA